jgi:hypothetical protein
MSEQHRKPEPPTRPDLPVYRPSAYPPLPPPPSPQLPDFRPRGMHWVDKTLAWLMAFIVLVFGLVVAAHFLLKPAVPGKVPVHPSTSSTAHHAKAKATTSACITT